MSSLPPYSSPNSPDDGANLGPDTPFPFVEGRQQPEEALIAVLPMDMITVTVDEDTQSIVVMLTHPQVERSPVMLLNAAGAVRLIQGLRMAIKEVEKLPPSPGPFPFSY